MWMSWRKSGFQVLAHSATGEALRSWTTMLRISCYKEQPGKRAICARHEGTGTKCRCHDWIEPTLTDGWAELPTETMGTQFSAATWTPAHPHLYNITHFCFEFISHAFECIVQNCYCWPLMAFAWLIALLKSGHGKEHGDVTWRVMRFEAEMATTLDVQIKHIYFSKNKLLLWMSPATSCLSFGMKAICTCTFSNEHLTVHAISKTFSI